MENTASNMETIAYDTCPGCSSKNISTFLKTKDYFLTGEKYTLLRCTNCTLAFTQHIPKESEIGKYYKSEEYISHSDTGKSLLSKIYHIARRYMLRQKYNIIREAASDLDHTLLDIGSGTGYFSAYMKSQKWNVQGIEPDEDARKICLEKFNIQAHSPSKLFSLTDQFSIVTMWHVLEHVHKLHEYARQIHHIIKKNGYWIVAVPNYTSTDASYYKKYWAAYDVPRHLYHFSPQAAEYIFKKYNFKLIKKAPLPLDSFYVSMLSEKYSGNKLAFLKGMVIGCYSCLTSIFNVNKASSVVYLLKKVS